VWITWEWQQTGCWSNQEHLIEATKRSRLAARVPGFPQLSHVLAAVASLAVQRIHHCRNDLLSGFWLYGDPEVGRTFTVDPSFFGTWLGELSATDKDT
jgi:hypothetical protein